MAAGVRPHLNSGQRRLPQLGPVEHPARSGLPRIRVLLPAGGDEQGGGEAVLGKQGHGPVSNIDARSHPAVDDRAMEIKDELSDWLRDQLPES